MTKNRMLLTAPPYIRVLLTFVLTGVCLPSAIIQAAAPASVDAGVQIIDIPPGNLVNALEHVAKQFALELVYDPDQLVGVMSPAISGRMTAMEAIHRLLEGQNLRLIVHPDGAILIAPPLPGESKPGSPLSTAQRLGSAAAGTDSEQPVGPPASRDTEKTRRETLLGRIVVTGTHIEGEIPVGSSLSVHTRDEIERSGSATLEQFGRKMPENYSSTDSLATLNTNVGIFEQGAASNVFGGAGFNLKGLGPGSTLTLLNGHRLAAGGLDGGTVDISQIPLSAIDHIEVLDDGASAIYGSDAEAGVVNVIMRHDFDGAETNVHYGRATQGGAIETTVSQLAGRSWEYGGMLLDYEYDDQGGLDASQRSWIGSQGGPFSLIPENHRHSMYATGHQNMTDDSTISADILYSDRRFESNGIENAIDPLFNNLQKSVGRAAQSSVVVGFTQAFLDTWSAGVTANYSSVRQTNDSTSLALGSDTAGGNESQHLQANSAVYAIDSLLTGSLISLPGGPLKISMGVAYREEQFDSTIASNVTPIRVSTDRTVASGYGEIIAPVIEDGKRGFQRFELSAALRYDNYHLLGTTRNPKVGWLWEPVNGIQLKGTGGTSFKAPLLSQLAALDTSYTAFFPSTTSGVKDDVLIVNGGQPGLDAESSTSVTVGIDVEPSETRDLVTSLNYFWLRLDNRIRQQNILPQPILSQPSLISLTETGLSVADVTELFQGTNFLGDGTGLGPQGVDMVVFNIFANTRFTIERGLTASGRYRWNADVGHFDVSLSGQYLLSDLIRTTFFAQDQTVDNRIGEPPKFKARGNIGWTHSPWLANLALNYVNSYRNTLFTPSRSIGAWTTADAYLGYSTAADTGHLWNNVQIGLSIQNLFDRRPPFLQIPSAYLAENRNAIPFDGANASPVGRQLSLQFKKGW